MSASSESSAAKAHYPTVDPRCAFPDIERAVLASWEADGTFAKSVAQRPSTKADGSSNEFVFYDGPPFANGLPHYGHLLTGYVKDVVPRYRTMKGERVERRFGWDCHGLPAEMEAEKELGISGVSAITEFGIDKFNAQCKQSVLKYRDEWRAYVTRQARWVDFDNDYRTMDASYMESVMWAFKQLHDKGLVYEGHRVMPYSWAMETPVSNHETRMDDATRPRQDPAITVTFRLEPKPSDPGPLDVMVWTTTPWTLPSNLALAVGPDIAYSVMRSKDGEGYFVIGQAAAGNYEKELEDAEEVAVMQGSELIERAYTPIFPYFVGHENSFRVLGAEFVDTEEGTGVVHMAPGFGEDDQKTCEEHGIQLVCPVDSKGRYTSEVTDYVGELVFDANKPIIRRLKDEGKLVRHVTYEHNYPHCWRTREPLIYKAVPGSWFVSVTQFKERMAELNRGASGGDDGIQWIPSHVRDGQFGKWLENARDWSISRNRFWGMPIPVWKSDDPAHPREDVYGSLDELERDFGVRPDDLHRPFIDELTRPNPDDPSGKSTMRRVPEVLDCWFESGSMPYAQVHYPFEKKDWFEHHFPADFIVEYVAQTRGWFYTLMVLGTALFDRKPFSHVICHGVVLDEKGQKLSKSLRNYPDPVEMFESHGADALRWFLVSSPILRGQDLAIAKDGKDVGEVVRLVLNPIWNAYYFFTLYANSDGVQAKRITNAEAVLDRYALAKTRTLVEQVTAALDGYDLAGACQFVTGYLDALNNWYIRRSRPRFWRSSQDVSARYDKQAAYDTLYTCMSALCRVAAPLLPLLTEEVYRGLSGEESVHLTDWPKPEELPEDAELVRAMDTVRAACSTGLSLRESRKLRTRLPLAAVTLAGNDVEGLKPYASLIADELNVKEVRFSDNPGCFGTFRLKVNARVMGPALGKHMKSVMAASRKGEWTERGDGTVEVAGQVLQAGQFELALEAPEEVAAAALPGNREILVLDTEVTPELEREGQVRDLVRLVQQARKDADLQITDRIHLALDAPDEVHDALVAHETWFKDQTLTEEIMPVDVTGDGVTSGKLGGVHAVRFVVVTRA